MKLIAFITDFNLRNNILDDFIRGLINGESVFYIYFYAGECVSLMVIYASNKKYSVIWF